MLIFNNNDICSDKFRHISKKNKAKTSNAKTMKKNKGKIPCMKRTYKSKCKPKKGCYSSKSVDGVRPKKSKVLRRKVSKKNTQFLEALGLKVKQKQ